jgi:hypothetical protein
MITYRFLSADNRIVKNHVGLYIVENMLAGNKTMLSKYAINDYKLPVPKKLLQRIDRTSSPAHMGKLRNAIDFIVREEILNIV